MPPEPVTTTFQQVLEMLKTGGPWTLVIFLGWVVRFLYVKRETDKEKHDEAKQKLNDRILEMANKQNEVLERAVENQALILETIQGAPRQLTGR